MSKNLFSNHQSYLIVLMIIIFYWANFNGEIVLIVLAIRSDNESYNNKYKKKVKKIKKDRDGWENNIH